MDVCEEPVLLGLGVAPPQQQLPHRRQGQAHRHPAGLGIPPTPSNLTEWCVLVVRCDPVDSTLVSYAFQLVVAGQWKGVTAHHELLHPIVGLLLLLSQAILHVALQGELEQVEVDLEPGHGGHGGGHGGGDDALGSGGGHDSYCDHVGFGGLEDDGVKNSIYVRPPLEELEPLPARNPPEEGGREGVRGLVGSVGVLEGGHARQARGRQHCRHLGVHDNCCTLCSLVWFTSMWFSR